MDDFGPRHVRCTIPCHAHQQQICTVRKVFRFIWWSVIAWQLIHLWTLLFPGQALLASLAATSPSSVYWHPWVSLTGAVHHPASSPFPTLEAAKLLASGTGVVNLWFQRVLQSGLLILDAAASAAPTATIPLVPWGLTLHVRSHKAAPIAFLAVVFSVRRASEALRGWLRARGTRPSGRRPKFEHRCCELMEQMFGQPFVKARPPWLVNPKTKRPLELDVFNEALQLAVEYDGRQHVRFTPFFHKESEDFITQQERDALKDKLCRLHGITLIRVPATVKYPALEAYLRSSLIQAGSPPPSRGKGFGHTLQQWMRHVVVAACVWLAWPECTSLPSHTS
eukprot:EG_transcript_18504